MKEFQYYFKFQLPLHTLSIFFLYHVKQFRFCTYIHDMPFKNCDQGPNLALLSAPQYKERQPNQLILKAASSFKLNNIAALETTFAHLLVVHNKVVLWTIKLDINEREATVLVNTGCSQPRLIKN